MTTSASILDELRVQYESTRKTHEDRSEVEGYEAIDKRLRHAYQWLDRAFSYLDGVKPAITHRFDVGHGLVFEAPRFGRGYVGQHERRVVGYPVIDEINLYYEIAAAQALTLEVAPGGVQAAEQALDDAGLQYTCRRVEGPDGVVRKCVISVPPAIPAKVSFHVDYVTGLVTVPLVNVDRFDRVALEFHSQAIEEAVLDDLLKFILGRDSTFLRRAPLAGLHGVPRG